MYPGRVAGSSGTDPRGPSGSTSPPPPPPERTYPQQHPGHAGPPSGRAAFYNQGALPSLTRLSGTKCLSPILGYCSVRPRPYDVRARRTPFLGVQSLRGIRQRWLPEAAPSPPQPSGGAPSPAARRSNDCGEQNSFLWPSTKCTLLRRCFASLLCVAYGHAGA